VVYVGSAELDLCVACGGLWFDRGEIEHFRQLSDDEQTWDGVQALVEIMQAVPATRTPSGYPGCPICVQPMIPKRLGGELGIVTATCAMHGAWIDQEFGLRLIEVLSEDGNEAFSAATDKAEVKHLRNELNTMATKQRSLSHKVSRVRRFQRLLFVMDWLGFV
jgi:Zn-finger nucleic acid-binding protein